MNKFEKLRKSGVIRVPVFKERGEGVCRAYREQSDIVLSERVHRRAARAVSCGRDLAKGEVGMAERADRESAGEIERGRADVGRDTIFRERTEDKAGACRPKEERGEVRERME